MKTLIVFLIIFSIIVVIHEFGHFYMAKKSGILVREFAVGMGPKLFSFQDKEGTTYTLRMLPLGGYVRMAGLYEEDGIEPGMEVGLTLEDNQVKLINLSNRDQLDELPIRVDKADLINDLFIEGIPVGQDEIIRYPVARKARIIETDGTQVPIGPADVRYESASVWNKFLTNAAGPFNNFILSIIAFSLFAFLIGGGPSNENIVQVIDESPAQAAGIQSGDRITAIDGQSIENWQDIIDQTRSRPNQTVDIRYERDGQELESKLEIKSMTDDVNGETYGQMGVTPVRKDSFMDKILFGFTETWAVITGVFGIIGGMLVKGFDLNNFGGPVAMAQMTGKVVDSGFSIIVFFLASLSANIGVFNLLPIPALDGGKILLNLIEAIRGKPLSQSKEGIITIIGVIVMVILMIAVTWNDIQRAFF